MTRSSRFTACASVALAGTSAASMVAVIALIVGGTSDVEEGWFATANHLASVSAVLIAAIIAASAVQKRWRGAARFAVGASSALAGIAGFRVVILIAVFQQIDPSVREQSRSGIFSSIIGSAAGVALLPVAFGSAALIAFAVSRSGVGIVRRADARSA